MAVMQSQDDRQLDDQQALERHALVMTVWMPLGFVAFLLFGHGYRVLDGWFVGAAIAVLLAAFAGHVIVNWVYRTLFSGRELALGLVAYVVALLAFLLSLLFGAEGAEALFLPIGLGFVTLAAAVIFYLVTHLGLRRSFEAFDVIRDFRPRGPGSSARR